jgi:Outer membrane protein beta-barrel domain
MAKHIFASVIDLTGGVVEFHSRVVRIFVVCLSLLAAARGRAQAFPPRFEAGVQFTGLHLVDVGEGAAGLGGRFGVNLTKYIAVEAEFNHFPKASSDFGEDEGLFGVKLGVRNEFGGVFLKARPGFVHFPSDGAVRGRGLSNPTEFAFDFGLVAEKYVGNHFLMRFDAGDTVLAYGGQHLLDVSRPGGQLVSLGTTNNFQVSVGVGVRF